LQAGLTTPTIQALIIGRYTSIMRTKPGQAEQITPVVNGSYTAVNALPSTFFLDATFNLAVGSGVTLAVSVTNIINSTAIVSNLPQGYRPSMPRSGNVGVKCSF
jgi:Fe(3+) dicitrate transport protein